MYKCIIILNNIILLGFICIGIFLLQYPFINPVSHLHESAHIDTGPVFILNIIHVVEYLSYGHGNACFNI